jgi:hypothetical protein
MYNVSRTTHTLVNRCLYNSTRSTNRLYKHTCRFYGCVKTTVCAGQLTRLSVVACTIIRAVQIGCISTHAYFMGVSKPPCVQDNSHACQLLPVQ